ncbi:MAG: hypothetical protein HRT58_11820 [Crocinitomicaceae bacterium]|nr:hypothetical protein [Flavobacteriales bacterium]NQZ36347.1 hypothetical protein [Crocinitomicaceae bacterium]
MLGLVIIYFIGKSFFNLAKKHERNKWLFGILGVVTYYGMTIVGGLIIVFIAAVIGNESIFELPDIVLGLMGIPIGLLSIWLLHYMLRKNWEGHPKDQHPELLDGTDF